MKTEVLAAVSDPRSEFRLDPVAIHRAVDLLQEGEPVALPTETVYGLAAVAIDAIAAARIFETKNRPRFDPLIVHIPDPGWIEQLTIVDSQKTDLVTALVERFWPGPLTVVLPKTDLAPDLVTAGLSTVALRMSAHPVFSAVIEELGQPLAAPSANRFGRISPTTAEHVMEELGGRVRLILDGGPAPHGIESTIVAIQGDKLEILRRGPVTEESLAEAGFPVIPSPGAGGKVRAPGQMPSHYAPATPLRLFAQAREFAPGASQRVGLLAWNRPEQSERFSLIRQLSETGDLREAAANLFRYLRELDAANLDLIVAEQVPNRDLGLAINDRLRRAAGLG